MRYVMFFLLAFATTAQAQSTLRVTVSDATNGARVKAAVLTFTRPNGSVFYAETDSLGLASVARLTAGRYTVAAQAIGYESTSPRELDIGDAGSTDLNLTLQPAPIGLAGIEATAKAQPGRLPDLVQRGFYDRMKFNNGIFIDYDEIRNRNQQYLSELIRNKPGISMRPGAGGENYVWFRGNESVGMSGSGVSLCGPAVYIDGALAQPSSNSPTPIDRLMSAADVAGIEIYRRPSQIPQQYGGANAGCGIILLWTRLKS